ncbi:MAG: hypothetical protein H8E10_11645, partial [Desulfobacterales bacterium]|nr:hypothetical protein [Desulfobacterales bacterium]
KSSSPGKRKLGQCTGPGSKLTESQVIQDALKRNHFNRLAAATELGMHKSTLFRKIKALDIRLPKMDGRSRSKKA